MVRTWCALYILTSKCASRHNGVHFFVGKERYGSDDSVDGGETVGNSLGRAPCMGKERDGSDNRVHGGETVGNSLGRALWGRRDTEATRWWTAGKQWEIAWGELRWEGAIWKRRESGGGEPVGNSMWGELRWEGAMQE